MRVGSVAENSLRDKANATDEIRVLRGVGTRVTEFRATAVG